MMSAMSDFEIDPNESDEEILHKLRLIKLAEAQRASERQDLNAIELATAPLASKISATTERALCREVLRLRAELDELKRKLD